MVAYLDAHSGALIAVLTMLLVVVTALYAWLTRASVREMRKQRLDSALPIVTAIWMNTAGEGDAFPHNRTLSIQNSGLGPALSVRVRVADRKGDADRLVREVFVSSIGPGGYYRTPIKAEPHVVLMVDLRYVDVYGRQISVSHRVDSETSLRLEVAGRRMLGG
jgi:hypothetical protein